MAIWITAGIIALALAWHFVIKPEQEDKLMAAVLQELGPWPPVGTPARDEHSKILACMYTLEKSQAYCRNLLRESQR